MLLHDSGDLIAQSPRKLLLSRLRLHLCSHLAGL